MKKTVSIAVVWGGMLAAIFVAAAEPPVPVVALPRDYVLIWQDEFDGRDLDAKRWSGLEYRHSGGGGFAASAVVVSGGTAKLTLEVKGKRFTGARISSQGWFAHGPAYYEVRARVPSSAHARCVIRLMSPFLGQYADDPGRGGAELHMMQTVGTEVRDQSGLFQGVYWNPYVGTTLTASNVAPFRLESQQSFGRAIPRPEDSIRMEEPPPTAGGSVLPEQLPQAENIPWDNRFHVYSLLWTKDRYRFFVDGNLTHDLREGISGVPEFLEAWIDYPSSSRPAQEVSHSLELDYVRVFSLPEPQPGGSASSATPDAAPPLPKAPGGNTP